MKSLTPLIVVGCMLLIAGCGDDSLIYQNEAELAPGETVKIHSVRITHESADSLTVTFDYSYAHPVSPEKIKLFVLPDHGYWSTQDVAVQAGRHQAQAIIGLSRGNMERDDVTESETTKLRFRFDHYEPGRYVGNVWGLDVDYPKTWTLRM